MDWIRTYDFKWINLHFVSIIAYREVFLNSISNVVGYRVFCETPEGTVDIGCLVEEDDVFDYMLALVDNKPSTLELYSEEEIREIYQKSKK